MTVTISAGYTTRRDTNAESPKGFLSTERSVFTKTPLWETALRLETDGVVVRETRH